MQNRPLPAGPLQPADGAVAIPNVVLSECLVLTQIKGIETTITSMLLLSQRHLPVGTMTVRAIVRGRALVVGW